MPSVLSQGQYQICRYDNSKNLTYGQGAGNLQVVNTQYAPGTMATQDQAHVGTDGTLFGVDTQPSATITQTGLAMTTPATGTAAMDAFDALAAIWNDPLVRLTPGSVQVLRFSYKGTAVTRRVFGRGRAIQPTYGQVFQGLVPWTAQFLCADGNIYDDALQSATLTLNTAGSFYPGRVPVAPPHPPGPVSPPGQPPTATFTIGGSMPTWPVFTFTGPVNNPTLTFLPSGTIVGYSGSIKSGSAVTIDSRPWFRSVMLDNGYAPGNLSGYSIPMIQMALWPGTATVRYEGNIIGTTASTCTISWYNAVQSLGGSI